MIVTATHAAIALSGHESLAIFIVLQALTMGCFAFTSSNLGTLAMEHMAPIAGTASSVQGVIGTLGRGAHRLRHRPGSSTARRSRSSSGLRPAPPAASC